MLLGLCHCELQRTCLQFMPKLLQNENKIKEVLDHQLCNLRMTKTDPMGYVT